MKGEENQPSLSKGPSPGAEGKSLCLSTLQGKSFSAGVRDSLMSPKALVHRY